MKKIALLCMLTVTLIIGMTASTMLGVWLGQLITEHGIAPFFTGSAQETTTLLLPVVMFKAIDFSFTESARAIPSH